MLVKDGLPPAWKGMVGYMLQKIRVHEVAKDLKLKSTELLDMFTQHGITLKNHMATLDEKQLSLIFEVYTQKTALPEGEVDMSIFGDLVKKEEAAPKEAAPEQKLEKAVEDSKQTEKPAVDLNTPIERKMRHVDTRQTVVDLEKMDTTRIEDELVPKNIKVEPNDKEAKVKKQSQRQRDGSNSFKKQQERRSVNVRSRSRLRSASRTRFPSASLQAG